MSQIASSQPHATGAIAARDAAATHGYIDFFGYAAAAGGWVFCGWASQRWTSTLPTQSVTAVFETGQLSADTLVCWHDRPDLLGRGVGVVVFVAATGRGLGDFQGIEVSLPAGGTMRIQGVRPLVHLREADLVTRARALVASGLGEARPRLLGLLARKVYEGVDTLDRLPAPVHLDVDETILVPPSGMILMGWFLDPTHAVSSIRLRSGAGRSEPLHQRWIQTSRQDVADAFAPKLGALDARCGFVAYAPATVDDTSSLYLEVELQNGEIGYKKLPAPVRRGVNAIRRVLEGIALATDEIESAFDQVLGPSLTAINRVRLAQRPKVTRMAFGEQVAEPVCSVIIPLYGRMDFMMYQLALFSEGEYKKHQFIYVLDDPPRKRELQDLAHSAHRRFGVPFEIVFLDENLGFAPANNVGLEYARGEYVCYLNSDIMPSNHRWLDYLVGDLQADRNLGIVGAILLFEDGSVQHQGLTFERLPQLANWPFPMHPGKGRRRAPPAQLVSVDAVTGACMVLSRSLAVQMGGFDEDYVIGDFEDSDLCLRIRRDGLSCAVDGRAQLYHLERQSQVTPDKMWRMYVTLLNAWTHTRRWFASTRFPAPSAKPPSLTT
jgi:GT2 family glycosyltransferase